MANPLRGELEWIVDRHSYNLVMDINALCSAEQQLGMGIDRIIASYASEATITLVRGVLWASLRQHHPEVSINQVGDMISVCGLPDARKTMEALLLSAMPDPDSKKKTSAKPVKKATQAGIG